MCGARMCPHPSHVQVRSWEAQGTVTALCTSPGLVRPFTDHTLLGDLREKTQAPH